MLGGFIGVFVWSCLDAWSWGSVVCGIKIQKLVELRVWVLAGLDLGMPPIRCIYWCGVRRGEALGCQLWELAWGDGSVCWLLTRPSVGGCLQSPWAYRCGLLGPCSVSAGLFPQAFLCSFFGVVVSPALVRLGLLGSGISGCLSLRCPSCLRQFLGDGLIAPHTSYWTLVWRNFIRTRMLKHTYRCGLHCLQIYSWAQYTVSVNT